MRFAAVKSEEQQASAVVFRACDLLVRQRTQTINALLGHLAEYGLIVAKRPSHIAVLNERAKASDSGVPAAAQPALDILAAMLAMLGE